MPDPIEYDIVIVGGGPAALAAAIYAGRSEMRTLVLERSGLGGQVALTHAIENYPGFPEGIAGPELTTRMAAQAARFGVETRIEEVTRLDVEGPIKILTTSENCYRAPAVILAMGADPRKLNVPGESELRGRGVSYCATCDGPFFRGKKLVVVGGGDTALKEALFLTHFASEVVIVHRRDTFRAEKIYQTEAAGNPKIRFEPETVVQRILGEQKVEGVELRHVKSEAVKKIDCEGVFIFVGRIPNTSFLKNVFPKQHGGQLETDRDMMTCEPGLFAIGDVRQYSYRQIAAAVGEGAMAAIAAENWISAQKAEGKLKR